MTGGEDEVHWVGHVAAWRASGESRTVYARAQSLDLNRFYYHAKKLAPRASSRPPLLDVTEALAVDTPPRDQVFAVVSCASATAAAELVRHLRKAPR